MSARAFDAVVLAGGSARRMDGADKPALYVGGSSLLDLALAAVAAAVTTVVVGPARPVARPVVWARERPPGGGPVAAMAAGLREVSADLVVVIAADLPFLTAAAVAQLVAAAPAMAVDDEGRDQPLLAAYPTDALRTAIPAEPAGARLRAVTDRVSPARVRLAGTPPPWWDCDTPAELQRAREWHDAR